MSITIYERDAQGNKVPKTVPETSEVVTASNTAEVTIVKRSVFGVSSLANINSSTAGIPIPYTSPTLDEIGITVGANSFPLPAGDYEVHVNVNLTGGTRTNFYYDIVEGGSVIQTCYGHVYSRNSGGHEDVGQSCLFAFSTTGGTFEIESRREAGTGSTQVDGGTVIIRKYEKVTVFTT